VTAAAPAARPATATRLAGLQSAARLITDRNGVTHIEAASVHDLSFLQGWVHARDRLFQMDVSRREPSGTLAELLGKAALPGDVQARTIGLRRAAERSRAAAPPDLRAALTAYADGVNAYVADHPLRALPARLSDGAGPARRVQGRRAPAGTDLSTFKSAVIWCRRFAFGFGMAPLSS